MERGCSNTSRINKDMKKEDLKSGKELEAEISQLNNILTRVKSGIDVISQGQSINSFVDVDTLKIDAEKEIDKQIKKLEQDFDAL